jgi:hypothetical protein
VARGGIKYIDINFDSLIEDIHFLEIKIKNYFKIKEKIE